jgi:hypothetical protein
MWKSEKYLEKQILFYPQKKCGRKKVFNSLLKEKNKGKL